jgi:vacuolar protein sorting-associated protein 54
MLATDVLQRVVELLRLFNSRATQLVLMAGAIHSSARLTKITAKHLAVTSQCLCLVMALLPHIRAALSAQLPPKHHLLLVEFDRVKQDYIEHHETILSKFVSIVTEVINFNSKSIAATDWDSSHTNGEAPATSSSNFVAETIKNTTTLHKVLSAQLPPEQVQEIFSRIFELFNQKIPEFFAEVSPRTPAGQQRLVDEITYLCHSMERLRGVSAANLDLEAHFHSRFPDAH